MPRKYPEEGADSSNFSVNTVVQRRWWYSQIVTIMYSMNEETFMEFSTKSIFSRTTRSAPPPNGRDDETIPSFRGKLSTIKGSMNDKG
ncbi:MAG: hypothetical protein M1835_002478 [Candelina submexicana]|nr:MAG: hypothetical protein M1835_002478 [Candelina submexicana]